MKQFLLIIPVFLSFNLQTQSTLNELNEQGLRDGKWIEYREDGLEDRLIIYEASSITSKIGTTDDFFYGREPTGKDTTIHSTKVQWMEIYFYDSLNKPLYIHYVDYLEGVNVFAFGMDQPIVLDSVEYSASGRVGELKEVRIPVQNRTKQAINLMQTSSNKSIKFNDVELPPESSIVLIGQIQIEQGNKTHLVKFRGDSVAIQLSIETYGYEIRSEDVIDSITLDVPLNFNYFRTGNEALLTVLDIKSNEVLKRIPLSTQNTNVDLSNLTLGSYLLEMTDYSTNKKTTCNLELR